jgi:hypothetical protein
VARQVSTRKTDRLAKAIGIAAQVVTAAVPTIVAEPLYGESGATGMLPDGNTRTTTKVTGTVRKPEPWSLLFVTSS